MVDLHIHIARRNGRAIDVSDRAEFAAQLRANLEAYRERGITFLRDGGDMDPASGLLARRLASELGIRYQTPVFALVRRGGYGGFIGREVEGIPEIREALRELYANGANHIKVVQSGIVSFETFGEISDGGFEPNELSYIVASAHDAGLSVMAHCNGSERVGAALDAGVDSIEHGYFIGEAELALMRELDTLWVPTFVPLSNYLPHSSVAERRVIERTLELHRWNLRRAMELGVRVGLGSDAGAYCVSHGEGALDELEYMRSAGLNEEQAGAIAERNTFS